MYAVITEKDFMNEDLRIYSDRRVDYDGVPFKFNQIYELAFEKDVIGFSFRYEFGSNATLRNVNLMKRSFQLKSLKIWSQPNLVV